MLKQNLPTNTTQMPDELPKDTSTPRPAPVPSDEELRRRYSEQQSRLLCHGCGESMELL